MYTPYDMLEYVYSHEYKDSFLMSVAKNKSGYSIGEIVDKSFEKKEDGVHFASKGYSIDVLVEDDDVLTAVMNGLYVSAFISRNGDTYRVHFLVHKYPEAMKPDYEEEILEDVIRFMILNTIVALRLDNKEKIRKYCN